MRINYQTLILQYKFKIQRLNVLYKKLFYNTVYVIGISKQTNSRLNGYDAFVNTL